MADASFRDAERPLRLAAQAPGDVTPLSAVLQDAIGVVGDAKLLSAKRRFVALLNRFRWEDAKAAERAGRPYERVRCLLTVENVLSAQARGLDPAAAQTPFSVLSAAFESGADGAGVLRLTLAGGADLALSVEALDVTLADVARPHAARGRPDHDAATEPKP
jgi:hypothetical protein